MTEATIDPAALTYDDRGLLPVVVQDVLSGAVLMLAYANREAVELTLATGQAHFFSRSRQELWRKGATSGNTLAVVEVLQDCDRDALLVRALPAGPACHNYTRSCFEPNVAEFELGWLAHILAERASAPPEESYTARLVGQGVDRIARKVAEEAGETVIAGVRADAEPGSVERRDDLAAETADLAYHLLVLLQATGVELADVAAELGRRHQEARGTGRAPGPPASASATGCGSEDPRTRRARRQVAGKTGKEPS